MKQSQQGNQLQGVTKSSLASALALLALSQGAYAGDFNIGRLPLIQNAASGANSMLDFMRTRNAIAEIQSNDQIRSILANQANQLSLTQRIEGHGVTTTKLQHYFQGVEVLGSMVMHHSNGNTADVDDQTAKFDLKVRPSLTQEVAASIARGEVRSLKLNALPELKILPRDGGGARLVYWVKNASSDPLSQEDVVVDANSGAVLARSPKHIEIAPVNVYTGEQNVFEITQAQLEGMDPQNPDPEIEKKAEASCQTILKESGSPLLINLPNCTQVIGPQASQKPDLAAQNAFNNSKAVLEYYLNVHKRNGLDDKGGEVHNVVHIGAKFGNAFWNPEENLMAYGDGDGEELGDMTAGLDVSGHEHTHGVVTHTANFLHFGQPGAINEASADFFGKMIANDGDWAIGKKVFVDPNAKGIRDLKDPHNLTYAVRDPKTGQIVRKPYPASVSEMRPTSGQCSQKNDYCYVHINSTVIGHALYNLHEAVGREKAEKMYYLALTQFMTGSTNFKGVKDATLKACGKLYDAATCESATGAFTAVGL